jgi:flagellar biosynthetic protein FliR
MDYFVLNFQIFLLVLVRVFGMFVVAPFYASDAIPARIRVISAVYITACVFPLTANYVGPVPGNMFDYAMLIVSEAMIGILIGFMMSIIFSAFQLAATFFSFQMALGIAEVIDPFSEVGVTVVGQLWTLMGISP